MKRYMLSSAGNKHLSIPPRRLEDHAASDEEQDAAEAAVHPVIAAAPLPAEAAQPLSLGGMQVIDKFKDKMTHHRNEREQLRKTLRAKSATLKAETRKRKTMVAKLSKISSEDLVVMVAMRGLNSQAGPRRPAQRARVSRPAQAVPVQDAPAPG